jgi:hypothetical protein
VVCSVIGFGSPGQAIIATHGGKTNDRSFSHSTIELHLPKPGQGKPQSAHRSLLVRVGSVTGSTSTNKPALKFLLFTHQQLTSSRCHIEEFEGASSRNPLHQSVAGGAPRTGARCKAQHHSHSPSMARICNAADRFKPRMRRR